MKGLYGESELKSENIQVGWSVSALLMKWLFSFCTLHLLIYLSVCLCYTNMQ